MPVVRFYHAEDAYRTAVCHPETFVLLLHRHCHIPPTLMLDNSTEFPNVSVCCFRLAGNHCSFDTLGIAGDDGEVGFGRLVGLRTALFPIPQSAQRDVVAQGKLLASARDRGGGS